MATSAAGSLGPARPYGPPPTPPSPPRKNRKVWWIVGAVGDTSAHVRVKADFGSQTSDVTLEVIKNSDGDRKLETVVAQLDFGRAATAKALTLFAKPVDSPAYVFPGWLDLGATNSKVAASVESPLLDALANAKPLKPTLKVTDAGHAAVMTQLDAAPAICAGSNLLNPSFA